MVKNLSESECIHASTAAVKPNADFLVRWTPQTAISHGDIHHSGQSPLRLQSLTK